MPKILFIGPRPTNDPKQNPGGQLSSAIGLVNYMEEVGCVVESVNTIQPSFPPPNQLNKIWGSISRVLHITTLLFLRKDYDACIMYCGGLSSFLERFLLCFFCRLHKVPVVLLIRNSALLKVRRNTLIGRFFKFGLNLSNKVVLQGQKWFTHLENLGVSPDKLEVVPSWLSEDWKVSTTPVILESGQLIQFIFIGWLVKDKGILEILEASKALKEEGYRFHFTMVGGGTLFEMSSNFITDHQLGDIVTLTGWQSREQIRGLLSKSHVFVLPTYHEGFPNALMEAMSLGLPAISTDVGAITETLINAINGYVVEVGSVSDLVTAMKQYLHDHSLVSLHSVKALEVVNERHTAIKNCKRILELAFAPKL